MNTEVDDDLKLGIYHKSGLVPCMEVKNRSSRYFNWICPLCDDLVFTSYTYSIDFKPSGIPLIHGNGCKKEIKKVGLKPDKDYIIDDVVSWLHVVRDLLTEVKRLRSESVVDILLGKNMEIIK